MILDKISCSLFKLQVR